MYYYLCKISLPCFSVEEGADKRTPANPLANTTLQPRSLLHNHLKVDVAGNEVANIIAMLNAKKNKTFSLQGGIIKMIWEWKELLSQVVNCLIGSWFTRITINWLKRRIHADVLCRLEDKKKQYFKHFFLYGQSLHSLQTSVLTLIHICLWSKIKTDQTLTSQIGKLSTCIVNRTTFTPFLPTHLIIAFTATNKNNWNLSDEALIFVFLEFFF